MGRVHVALWNPYLSSRDDLVEFEGRTLRPIVFELTRGRSDPVQYIFNYVRDGDAIYLVHKTNLAGPPKLKPLKSRSVAHFSALFWYVGKDDHNVFGGSTRKRVRSVSTFRLFEQELGLFFDGEVYYDRHIEVLPVDVATFLLIPKSDANRLWEWRQSNQYLESRRLPVLPFEHAQIYSHYAFDSRQLYHCNPNTQRWRPLPASEIETLLEGPITRANEDVRAHLQAHDHVRAYPWARPPPPI